MQTIDRTEFRKVRSGDGPFISMFLPACEPGGDSVPASIRLNGLIREAEQRLEGQGCPVDLVADLLVPVRELSRQPDSWEHHACGLALFRAPGFFRYHGLPFSVPESVRVGKDFHLAPLFRDAEADDRFYLLSLSHGGVNLFEAAAGAVTQTDLTFPESPVAHVGQHENLPHGRFAILNRRQVRDEHRKQALLGWFRRIDEMIRSRLGGDGAPVILVGVRYLCPMFRHISRYKNLLESEIHGNPDTIKAEELWQRGRAIASVYFRAVQERIADEYLRLWHTPRASNNIGVIEVAAREGRIGTLFVEAMTARRNGSRNTEPAREAQDLLCVAVLNTFMTGGKVYAVPSEQVPGRGSAAAVFRY